MSWRAGDPREGFGLETGDLNFEPGANKGPYQRFLWGSTALIFTKGSNHAKTDAAQARDKALHICPFLVGNSMISAKESLTYGSQPLP